MLNLPMKSASPTEPLKMEEKIKELTLLLIYLTSWKEKIEPFDKPILMCWKTFRFEVLSRQSKNFRFSAK